MGAPYRCSSEGWGCRLCWGAGAAVFPGLQMCWRIKDKSESSKWEKPREWAVKLEACSGALHPGKCGGAEWSSSRRRPVRPVQAQCAATVCLTLHTNCNMVVF